MLLLATNFTWEILFRYAEKHFSQEWYSPGLQGWLGISAHDHFQNLGKVTANLEEPENHKIDWVERDHTAHPVPTPCHGVTSLQPFRT